MKEKIIKILSEQIDHDLAKQLVNSYSDVKDAFIRGDNESTQAKSGKFVENVFRVLHFLRKNTVLKEIKPYQMEEEKEELRKVNSSLLSESIRLLIPSIAISMIYEPRSKLGSVHVKPINPDFIDARLTVTAADWIIAELLRLYHTRDTNEVDKIIRDVAKEYVPIIENALIKNLDQIGTQELILISLRLNCNQTKEQMKATFDEWGKVYLTWFNGGNFKARLLDKGLVRSAGSTESDEIIYSLTRKGELVADELIANIREAEIR